LGNSCNFIISYVKTGDFFNFWNKYLDFIKSFHYPFELIEFMVPQENQYPELKWAVTKLERNGILTTLYHIVIHIPS